MHILTSNPVALGYGVPDPSKPSLGIIPIAVWLLGAAGAAAWAGRNYSVPEAIDKFFTGKTQQERDLEVKLAREGKPYLTNPPRFPSPAAPNTPGEMTTWTPEQMISESQQDAQDYRATYTPVFSRVEWPFLSGETPPGEPSGDWGQLEILSVVLLGAGALLLVKG